MPPEKRNNFLDADDSDSDNRSQAYDSDHDIRKGSRTAKRRKLNNASDDAFSSDEGSASDSDGGGVPVNAKGRTSARRGSKIAGTGGVNEADAEDERSPTLEEDTGSDEEDDSAKAKAKKKTKLPKLVNTSDPLRSLVKKNLVSTEEAIKKSGVLYVSRIPPFMKPHKLRTLLEPFGTINRTYLAPEDPASHQRRVRAGGNKKKLFTEGWVEFVNKKDAKKAHELLNARTIGGKKGTYYRDDVWSLVYLKGFKWRDLTAQIERENAEREGRMRAEISKATRENMEFVRNIEQAKQLDGIKAKKEKRGKQENAAEAAPARTFKQVPQVSKKKAGAGDDEPAESVKRVLSKIF
ncbi:hypothetical protein jhhlp_007721 [Lomentospora prolificans]|uniref:18S rRNA factor 2 n=1 Tax=Lomentospora prolificans TaxID=41688 RepID=A0A2N3N0E1_9PEZI|nr:hypothetical protein jhhlp_007721 [Lomentospora prolificans]